MDPGLVSLRQEVRGGLKCRGRDRTTRCLTRFSTLPQFLLRVLTSWVQAIDDTSCSSPLPSSGPTADWWPSLCLELGSLLQVNPDILRRHLVCELYNQGLDLRAEEVSVPPLVVSLLKTEAESRTML